MLRENKVCSRFHISNSEWKVEKKAAEIGQSHSNDSKDVKEALVAMENKGAAEKVEKSIKAVEVVESKGESSIN